MNRWAFLPSFIFLPAARACSPQSLRRLRGCLESLSMGFQYTHYTINTPDPREGGSK